MGGSGLRVRGGGVGSRGSGFEVGEGEGRKAQKRGKGEELLQRFPASEVCKRRAYISCLYDSSVCTCILILLNLSQHGGCMLYKGVLSKKSGKFRYLGN